MTFLPNNHAYLPNNQAYLPNNQENVKALPYSQIRGLKDPEANYLNDIRLLTKMIVKKQNGVVMIQSLKIIIRKPNLKLLVQAGFERWVDIFNKCLFSYVFL